MEVAARVAQERVEAERDALRRELADLISVAESAMRQANNDGGEYDIKAELTDARRVAEANIQTAERASQSIDAVAAERDALRAQVVKQNELLRSAHAIAADYVTADRTADETNWRAFRDRLREALMDGSKPQGG